jgi:uroporphyrinogen III methyltransferase/synthase
MRGIELLQSADLVLHDYLINPAVLSHVPPNGEVVCSGVPGRRKASPQGETIARMIEAARQGKTVVRLKSGDPHVFARSAEETEALRVAGVSFDVVPGVTAALAAAGCDEIPVTQAGRASAMALVTGQESSEKAGPALDYGALAGFPGTLIFYMGVASVDRWSDALLRQGKSRETPVAIVRRCSWSDHQTIRCTLGTVAGVVAERGLRPPAVVIVGGVASAAPAVSWFTARPLFGRRVLVTRPRRQAAPLARQLTELGAQVDIHPVIEVSEPSDWQPVDRALARLDRYDWLVFSSANGVCSLLDRLLHNGGDLRSFGSVRLAAMGPGTADELARYQLRADLVPERYRAEALADALAAEAKGRSLLLVRASRGREVLAQRLAAAGALVEQVVVYSSDDVDRADPEVALALAKGQIDWITVTSSAIARSLARLFGDDLRRSKLASISPITSEALRERGYWPVVEARRYTMDGVVEAITGCCSDPAAG